MAKPILYIAISGNIATRMLHFENINDQQDGHVHHFDYVAILSRGSIRLTVGENSEQWDAPCVITVPKQVRHTFTALAEDTVLTTAHAIRAGETIDDVAEHDISEEQAVEFLAKYPLLIEF